MSVIETEALRRAFGTHLVITGLDLAVQAGEVFGLLGPNGAGKSTIIKMLTTLLPPTSGRAWVAGFDICREPAAVRRAIGYVPQLISADGLLTGFENLALFARLYECPGPSGQPGSTRPLPARVWRMRHTGAAPDWQAPIAWPL